MQETVLTKIVEFIFGRKYYANIINTRGTDMYEISCFIFSSKVEADRHRDSLMTNASFMYIETVSFRSRVAYPTAKR